MSRIFVKPTKQGQAWKLRDPVTRKPLPDDGGMVPDNAFWRRRIKNGDVVETEPPKGSKDGGDKGGKDAGKKG